MPRAGEHQVIKCQLSGSATRTAGVIPQGRQRLGRRRACPSPHAGQPSPVAQTSSGRDRETLTQYNSPSFTCPPQSLLGVFH